MDKMFVYVLMLIGGLGAFMVGLVLLQDATEKLATSSLKRLFSKTASSKIIGVLIGMVATMIMQSSGATTVMVVGFVNAGAMSLAQAATYIMGANIGTTITAQIVALGNFPISQIFIASTLVGVFLSIFFKKKSDKTATVGSLICGLGLLFLGLYVMTANMELIFAADTNIKEWLTNISNPFILLLIGIVLTVMVQSSSAITSLIIAMAIAGTTIGGLGNGVLFVILGTNIGSCSTALISSIGSTTNGKRAAMIHLLFNIFGSIIFFIMLILWKGFMSDTFASWFASPATQIAMFHTFFNVTSTVIFLPFVKMFVKLSTIIVPEKKKTLSMQGQEDILDERFMRTPGIALNQSVIYFHLMAKTALESLNMAIDAFQRSDRNKQTEIDALNKKVENMSKNLTSFTIHIPSDGLTEEGTIRISKMQLDTADIVRLAEVADNITIYTKHEVEDSLLFSDIVRTQLNDMKKLINDLFVYSDAITEKPSLDALAHVDILENKIDDLRTQMINEHLCRLNSGHCQPASSGVFINLVGNLERVGDHLNFISQRACDDLVKKHQIETGKTKKPGGTPNL